MNFVEGTYRIEQGEWKVFIFLAKSDEVRQLQWEPSTWESGVSGVVFRAPFHKRLNKDSVKRSLSDALGVDWWSEVSGPDSMQLR